MLRPTDPAAISPGVDGRCPGGGSLPASLRRMVAGDPAAPSGG